MRPLIPIVAFLALHLVFERGVLAEPRPPRSILVLQQSDARGPFYFEIFSALRSVVNEQSHQPVSIFLENLDLSRFSGAMYSASLLAHLKAKYESTPMGVIVAVGQGALDHVAHTREALASDIPVVFALVDQSAFAGAALPSGFTGIFMRLDLSDMVTVARALVPDLSGVAIVGDTFESQTVFRHFQDQIEPATKGLKVIDLVGLPMGELRTKVADLPDRTAILYTAIYSDGRGTFYPPADALALLAEVANRPIVIAAETFLGRGGTGGIVMVPSAIGEGAAKLALRIVDGEDPSKIPPTLGHVVKPIFDWRQLQRWNVDPVRLPPGSEIRYRPVSVWDQYAWHITGIGAAFLTLLALVITLLRERHTRLAAEVSASQRMSELAHINRHATAGEMSAAIAHELNQPLGAILNNTEAAAILLESGRVDPAELKTILADIRRDDERAGEIIKRLRALVTNKTIEFRRVDLNNVASEALAVAEIQAHSSGITFHNIPSQAALLVTGDPIQLQQVILNLAMNAIEATNERKGGPREIVTRTALANNHSAEFAISDFGPGIPQDKMNHLFEPFFTTKSSGMGIGLSLAHTIIEAHKGKLWAENGITGGAIFRFRLPLSSVQDGR